MEKPNTQTIAHFRPGLPVIAGAAALEDCVAVVRFGQRVDFFNQNALICSVPTAPFYLAKGIPLSGGSLLVLPVNSASFLVIRPESFIYDVIPLRSQVLDFFTDAKSTSIVVLEHNSVLVLDKQDFSQVRRVPCASGSRVDCVCGADGEIQYILVSGGDYIQIIDENDQICQIQSTAKARFITQYVCCADGRALQVYSVQGELLAEQPLKHFTDEILVLDKDSFLAAGGVTNSLVSISEGSDDCVLSVQTQFVGYASELAAACKCGEYTYIYEKLAVVRVYKDKPDQTWISILADQMAPVPCGQDVMLRSAHGIEFAELGEQIRIKRRLKAAGNEQFFAMVGGNDEIISQRDNTLIVAFAGAPNGAYCVSYAGDYKTRCFIDEKLVKELPMALGAAFLSDKFVLALPNGFMILDSQFNLLACVNYAIGTRRVQLCGFEGNILALLGCNQLILLAPDLQMIRQVTISDPIVRITPSGAHVLLIQVGKLVVLDASFQEVLQGAKGGQLVNAHEIDGEFLKVNTTGWSYGKHTERDPLWYFDSVETPEGLRLFAHHQIFQEWDLVRATDQPKKAYASLD